MSFPRAQARSTILASLIAITSLNCRTLTEKPHLAGSEENKQLAEMIYEQWRGYGMFDEVELVNYSVYLSYPSPDKGNVLQLLGPTGDVLYEANTSKEPPLTPGENDSTVVPPFNAYSGYGNATVSRLMLVLQTMFKIPVG